VYRPIGSIRSSRWLVRGRSAIDRAAQGAAHHAGVTRRDGAPAFRLRPPTLGTDEARLLAVHAASREVDRIDPISTLEWLPRDAAAVGRELASTGDPGRNAIVAEANGAVIGYALIWRWTERGGLRVLLHLERVVPAWRGRGVEDALIGWAEARIGELAAGPDEVGPWVYGANAASSEPSLAAALLGAGYRPAFPMVELALGDLAPRPEPPLPPGYVLRPVADADLRAIWESMHPAYDDPNSVVEEPTEEQFRAFAEEARRDATLWHIAWRDGRVAGMALGQVVGERGEVTELNVQPAHRRRGLARALLARTVNALLGRGVAHVRLHARGNNERALPLYRALGFAVLKEHVRYRRPGP
jgi:ribosomal protein S18 acetylase RimI-like enzyme